MEKILILFLFVIEINFRHISFLIRNNQHWIPESYRLIIFTCTLVRFLHSGSTCYSCSIHIFIYSLCSLNWRLLNVKKQRDTLLEKYARDSLFTLPPVSLSLFLSYQAKTKMIGIHSKKAGINRLLKSILR